METDKENIPPNHNFANIRTKAIRDRINAEKGAQCLKEFLTANTLGVEEDLPTPESPSGLLMPNLQSFPKPALHANDKEWGSYEKPPILANNLLEDTDSGCLEIHPITVLSFSLLFFNKIFLIC